MRVQLAQVDDLLDLLHEGEGGIKDNSQSSSLCIWVGDYRKYTFNFYRVCSRVGQGHER